VSKQSFVYIITNNKGGTLYTGVTTNLKNRTYQHRNKELEGFTKKYNLTKLVYFEAHEDIEYAIKREKNIKSWNRIWKIRLIEKNNPGWIDLYETL
jgi:putative endonuclease